MSRLPTGLALLLASAAGCGERPAAGASSCDRDLLRLEKRQDELLRHGARAVSRQALEAQSRADRGLAERCQGPPVTTKARWLHARIRESIARASRDDADLRAALLAYGQLVRSHPRDALAERALWRRATLALDFGRQTAGLADLQRLAAEKNAPRTSRQARARLALLTPVADATKHPDAASRTPASAIQGTAVDPDRLGIGFPRASRAPSLLLRTLRWSTPSFSRVVAYFSRPVRYLHGVLPRQATHPPRLYLDFPDSRLGRKVQRASAVRSHLVRGLRLADRPPRATRLVLDLSGPLRYQIYPLQHPYRVVVDLWTKKPRVGPAVRSAIRVVALDPGHGGADLGASGPTGLKEKDVALDVARQAAEALKQAGIKPVLTRDGDRAVTLEERSAIALAVGADLFVSIHANAEPTGKRQGIETYYLDVHSDEYAARLAARENRSAGRKVAPYRLVLADLTTRAAAAVSRQLAHAVQRRLVVGARAARPGLPDRGVRQAIFYVLLTARVPGILAEVSFISNRHGEAALARPSYRQALGRAIARGILDFIRSERKR